MSENKIKISNDTLSMLETALWSTMDYFDESPDDGPYGPDTFHLEDAFSVSDIPLEFQVKCQNYLNDFIDRARPLFTEEELNESPIGHDFWLTLHGHGAGFWDGDYESGDEITEIVRKMRNERGELEDELRDVLWPVWEQKQKEKSEE